MACVRAEVIHLRPPTQSPISNECYAKLRFCTEVSQQVFPALRFYIVSRKWSVHIPANFFISNGRVCVENLKGKCTGPRLHINSYNSWWNCPKRSLILPSSLFQYQTNSLERTSTHASSLNIIFEWMQIPFDEGSSIPILSKKKWKRKSKERTSHRNRSLRDVGNLISRLWVFMQIQDETGSKKRLSTSTYYNYDRIPTIYQLFTQQQVYVIKVYQVCRLPLLFARITGIRIGTSGLNR